MKKATVVIGHGSSSLLACGLANAGSGVPFAYRAIGDPGYWVRSRSQRWRVRTLLEQTSAVVALWSGAADGLRQYGVSRPIVVIPNGVRADRFPLVDAEGRAEARGRWRSLAVVGDEPLVVAVSALSHEKGVDLAISALSELPIFHLAIAGDGPARLELEQQARMIAPGRVHFLGTVEEPASVLGAGDVVVMPSRTEGMAAVLIEAGMSGLPVVATDVGAAREIVIDGETGILVSPGDASALAAGLRRVVDNLGPPGHVARKWCLERFEIGVVAAAWEEMIDQLA